MEYIQFSPEQLEQANRVDLEEFLLQHGEKLLHSGPEKRMASNHSTTIRGCEWFDHADRQGGTAISFVQRYLQVSFQEAVQILLGEQGIVYAPAQPRKEDPPKPFVLPPAHTDHRRMRAYLERSRGIHGDVLEAFEGKGLIYEDAQYHNAVFVGVDASGVARHAHKRSTNTHGKQFKINVEGCNARHSFHWTGSSDTIYVFEAPIDLLSFVSMKPDWKQHSYVALCGVAEHALLQQLDEQPGVSNIVLCLDNDEAGIQARKRITQILQERGYNHVSSLFPSNKDWNEDLQGGILMTEKDSEFLTLSQETATDTEASEQTQRKTVSGAETDWMPVGSIEYLGANGAPGEIVEYSDEEQFLENIKDDTFYGVPFTVVLYRDEQGRTISQDFLKELDPPPKGFRVENAPALVEEQVQPSEVRDFRAEYQLQNKGAKESGNGTSVIDKLKQEPVTGTGACKIKRQEPDR